jgi:hypothetical protein
VNAAPIPLPPPVINTVLPASPAYLDVEDLPVSMRLNRPVSRAQAP